MKSFKIFILLTIFGSVYGGGSSTCEPFLSDFLAFEQVWLNFVDSIQKYFIERSLENPVLIPAYIENLKCQSNAAFVLAANATNRLSGINSDAVLNILNGTLAPQFGTLLDCVAGDLVSMQQRILVIFDKVVLKMQSNIQFESITTNCSEVKSRFLKYREKALFAQMEAENIISRTIQAFSSINMGDLYQQYLNSILPCFFKSAGVGVGAILNADGHFVVQYFNGETTELPEPFNCISTQIDFVKNNLIKRVTSIFNGSATS